MEIAVAIGAALAILAVAVAAVVQARAAPGRPGRPRTGDGGVRVDADGRAVVTLEVTATDTSAPAVQRLVDDAARRVFAARPDVDEVIVESTAGSRLGVRRRRDPGHVEIPGRLYEPHRPARSSPDVREGLTGAPERFPGVRAGEEPEAVPTRPLADRFDLPSGVRERLRDPDDAVELVTAVLEVSGRQPAVAGDLVRVDEHAVVVVRAPIGEPLGGAALSDAYYRFRRSGASDGVVVTPGFFDPVEIRRRELLAPELRHAGPDGIQRMCDAAAVGADPLSLAAGPSLGPGDRSS